MADLKPGSWLGDGVEEFKKLPTWGKIAVGGVLLAVIAFAVYKLRQNQAASTSAAGTTSASSGSQSPFPSVNGVPLVPSGTTPIYDPNGNLIGWGSPPPPGGTPPPPPPGGGTPPPPPPPPPTNSNNPLIPFNFFSNGKFPVVKQFTYGGITYNITPGSGGRIWGTPTTGGSQVLLYAPQSYYSSATANANQQANQLNTGGLMANQNHYLQAATPHISAAHGGVVPPNGPVGITSPRLPGGQ